MAKSVTLIAQLVERMRYLQRTTSVPRLQPQNWWWQTSLSCIRCNLWPLIRCAYIVISRQLSWNKTVLNLQETQLDKPVLNMQSLEENCNLDRVAAKRLLCCLASNKAIVLKGLISPVNRHCTSSYSQKTFLVTKS